jgi:hypothetical protein
VVVVSRARRSRPTSFVGDDRVVAPVHRSFEGFDALIFRFRGEFGQ